MGAALKKILARHYFAPKYAAEAVPNLDGEIKLPHGVVAGPVHIKRDAHGVPHIYASCSRDLSFAQGFVHAQDRLTSMEITRRAGCGQLAEILGQSAVPTDRFMRTIGFRAAAEEQLAALREARDAGRATGAERLELDTLEAYAAGVNAFVREMRVLPMELRLLGCHPREWEPADSLVIARVMAFKLSYGWQHVVARDALEAMLGEDGLLWCDGDSEGTPVMDRSARVDPARAAGAVPPAREFKPDGSNAWAVSGARTDTGRPILASDPHLPVSVPSVWYEVHVSQSAPPDAASSDDPSQPPHSDEDRAAAAAAAEVAREAMQGRRERLREALCDEEAENAQARRPLHAAGAGIPGMPGVVIGHTRSVAWGVTLGYTDVQDLFLERCKWDGATLLYEHRGEWLPCAKRREVIQVKGEAAVELSVHSTCHGPVLTHDLATLSRQAEETLAQRSTRDALPDGVTYHYALCSVAAGTDLWLIRAICLLNRADNITDFLRGAKSAPGPPLSMAYADAFGHVGAVLSGRTPRRPGPPGAELQPLPGWTGEFDWEGEVPQWEAPLAINPPSGFMVCANHRWVDDDYPHYLGRVWRDGYRAKVLEQELVRAQTTSLQHSVELQLCVRNAAAEDFQGAVAGLDLPSREAAALQRMLAGWDARMATESGPAAVYAVAHRALAALLAASGVRRGRGMPPVGAADEDLREWEAMLDPASVAPGSDPFHAMVHMMVGGAILPALFGVSECQGKLYSLVLRLLRDPAHPWWSYGPGGTRESVVDHAFRRAFRWLEAKLGPDPSAWAWGRLHRTAMRHMFSGPLDTPRFDCPGLPLAGDDNTPCQTAMSSAEPFVASGPIPSYRMVADVGAWDNSRAVLPLGQSGQPGAAHYMDQYEMWRKGETHPMPWTPGAVARATKHEIQFLPTPGQ